MASLILLNGPPASGKSTLAQRYADDHPLTLNLDIDRIRALIGGWQDEPAASTLGRAAAVAAASAHLAAGYDVVVPQLLARLDFIGRLEALAQEVGADFRGVMLLPDQQAALRLYRERAATTAAGSALDPVISIDKTAAELAAVYAQLCTVLASRPAAAVMPVHPGQVAEAYKALLDILGR